MIRFSVFINERQSERIAVALPPDVRKAYGLPLRMPFRFLSARLCLAEKEKGRGVDDFGKAEPYRTSGGKAAATGALTQVVLTSSLR